MDRAGRASQVVDLSSWVCVEARVSVQWAHELGGGLCATERARRGNATHLINLQKDWFDDIVPDQLKIRLFEQVCDVVFAAGEQVVDADDVVATLHQVLAQMRADESSATRDEHPIALHARLGLDGRPVPVHGKGIGLREVVGVLSSEPGATGATGERERQ